MPPAFGAVFLWLMATILWWSGWREESPTEVPHWAVGVFLAIWPLAWLSEITVIPGLTINGAWLWTFITVVLLACRLNANRRWLALSTGVLIGSIYAVMSRLALYPSGLSHYFDPWGAAIVVGWLSALLLRNVSEQALAISAGLYLSEGISALLIAASGSVFEVRASEWMERWWIALLFSQLWALTVKALIEFARKRIPKIGTRRGGQRL
jgi:hypothetical protein